MRQLQRPSLHEFVLEIVNMAVTKEDKGADLVLTILIELFELSRFQNHVREIEILATEVNPGV